MRFSMSAAACGMGSFSKDAMANAQPWFSARLTSSASSHSDLPLLGTPGRTSDMEGQEGRYGVGYGMGHGTVRQVWCLLWKEYGRYEVVQVADSASQRELAS